jgi:uncharacterized protein (DUF1330 family)
MSAYVVVEFTVKDPDVYREKYGPNAGRTAKEYGGEVLANANWEILHGDGSLTSGALMRFPDHETVIKWYNSPEYQQLIDVRMSRWMPGLACSTASLADRGGSMGGTQMTSDLDSRTALVTGENLSDGRSE